MRRARRRLFPWIASLSLAAGVVGVGLVVWASMSIAAQSAEPVAANGLGVPPAPPAEVTSTIATPTIPAPEPVLYPTRPTAGERLGTLSVPALKQAFQIVEGTGSAQLKRGVGHFAQSVLPGEKDNCVLSGHRDTVFTDLGKLKVGDQFVVQTSAGTFTYAITGIRIVHKDDRTVIVPTDHAVLTVSTCYPFDYVGAAPKRYVLSADLVAPAAPRRTVD